MTTTRRLALLLFTGLTLVTLRSLALGAEPPALPAMSGSNPLLTPSVLPYHLPPFAQIKDEHFAPAFELGMAENLKEIASIATNPAAPTFDNTIVALEKSGQLLDRVQRAFGILTNSLTNPTLDALDSELSPKLAALNDTILLNPALFARVQALYDARETLGLDPESKRLLWRYHQDFTRAGANLSPADKEKLKAMNIELATLETSFNQMVLKGGNAASVLVENRSELKGLTENQITAAAAAAKKNGAEGKYLLRLTNTSDQPLLASLENRPLREKLHHASLTRCSSGGEFDTRATLARIARVRAERAVLLGYPNHAAHQVAEQTARDVKTVNQLIAQLAPPSFAKARREAAAMQEIIDAEHGGFTLSAWDWSFYAEKVRRAQYDFDESQLQPYFELRHVLVDGVFYAATQLYGITFKERTDLHGYSPDMLVFEVFEADGRPLGLFLGDFYARPNKRGGAWMSAYVPQSGLFGYRPAVANHLNIPQPPAGEPTLMTWEEVRTMFHEFGHALHGLFSNVHYPRFAGTSVPRDFVEYPSQVNEIWREWPSVLQHYARHYQTGAPLPQELVDKVVATTKFNQGFKNAEKVAVNVIDQAWHQLKPEEVPGADGVLAFEAAALRKAGVDYAPVPPRYLSTYFTHIFSGGYSAGYYSYYWSEVLDADTVDWIKAHGGLTRANGDRFRSMLLSRGGSREALDLFHDFTGSDPDIRPLLVRRGLDAGVK